MNPRARLSGNFLTQVMGVIPVSGFRSPQGLRRFRHTRGRSGIGGGGSSEFSSGHDSCKGWRVFLISGLGLLHGMGFALVMKELDLPKDQVLQPLVGFNLGVKVGQMTVLAGAFALTFWFIKHHSFTKVSKFASVFLAGAGIYWTIEWILF